MTKKLWRPAVKVGDVFDQQAFQQANRGAGHLSIGKQAIYENISFGQQVSSLISSSDQLVNSKMDNFIKSLSHNKSLAQEIGNTRSAIESNTDAFLDSFNHMSAADQARVYQDVVSGKIGAKMDVGGGVSAVLNMDRINKHLSASSVAEKLKGVGGKLGLSGGIDSNFSNQLTSTNSSITVILFRKEFNFLLLGTLLQQTQVSSLIKIQWLTFLQCKELRGK